MTGRSMTLFFDEADRDTVVFSLRNAYPVESGNWPKDDGMWELKLPTKFFAKGIPMSISVEVFHD